MIKIETKELMINILNDAIIKKASDIHLYPRMSGTAIIKYRIKGELETSVEIDNISLEAVISLLKFNANIDISLNKTPQSGRFEYELEGNQYFLRISTLPLNELYEGCVVRIFTNKLDDVNFSIDKADSQQIASLAQYANGLIIFSGPTGSGKSTSMYKLALDITKHNKQMISIEDPVEKHFDEFIQMQVNEKAGINYDNALKSILRCDPDAIMVGEIRDSKTAKYVITSAYSGHLVLTTIHAEDCIGVINRLVDLGVGKEDIKQTILCIISQRLVKTNDKRELITEIIDREHILDYLNHQNISFTSLKEKFERAYNEDKITISEKTKWGY